ncbi:MAG TPA: ATP-binding protein [Spirochaetota bacterium]|nr:ATP-binding protein [Spirochaetota bacterium]
MNENRHTGIEENLPTKFILKDENLSTERLISGIYRQALAADDLSVFFSECLRTIGESLGVSRIFLYEYREDSLVLKSIHEWTEYRLNGKKDLLSNIPKAKVPWWMKTIAGNEIIKYSDINLIPSAFERRVLKQIGIKSLLAVPLFLSKRFYGFIGIADNRRHREWEDDVIEVIKVASQIMTGVLSRKRAEEALAEEKERLAVTIKCLGDAVIATDTQGKITLMNSSAEKLTGWKFDEARGKSLTDVFYFIDEKTRELCHEPIHRQDPTGKTDTLSYNRILVSRDGTEKLVSSTISPILDRSSGYIGTVMVFKDVTGERNIQSELRKIQKLESLGNLASGLAHDYNNILTSVVGNVSLARLNGNSPEEIREYLDEAEKGLIRATGLTQRLVSFSRDDGVSDRRVADVRQLIEDTAVFSLHGSNCTVETRIDDDIWQARVNEIQMSQVFNNIFANAIQAMPEGGTITITARNVYVDSSQSLPLRDGKHIRIFIRDSGPGVPREIRDRIFDPFFTTRANSHGLGLAACYSIIKSHNGYITFQSSENEGTTFAVFIPAYDEQDSRGITGISSDFVETPPAFSKKGKILLLYDAETPRLITGNILKAMGYTIHQAQTVAESISMIEDAMFIGSPFDLLVIDIQKEFHVANMLDSINDIDPMIRILLIDEMNTFSDGDISKGKNIIVTKPQKITHLSLIIKSILAD